MAYSPCIAQGIALDAGIGARQQKMAVDCGQWLLYRFDPRRADRGENPLQLDSPPPKAGVRDYLLSENRFKMLTLSKPDAARQLFAEAQADVDGRRKFYEYMQSRTSKVDAAPPPGQKINIAVEPPPAT
jgi:pyruvate-ferredoxin/flavodoxin oxidoreductase